MAIQAFGSPDLISVLIAGSNQMQSQLLTGALRRQGAFKVAHCEAQLSECLSAMQAEAANVVLLADGLANDRKKGYGILRGLHSAYPKAVMVVLLEHYDRELVVNALRAGVRGLFCLTLMPFKSLCRCIRSVHQGQYWINAEQTRFVIEALSVPATAHILNSRAPVILTPREEQTVSLVADGLNNRGIARMLQVKENTVKKSLMRIYDKLGVSNRVELVLFALSHWQEIQTNPVSEQEPVKAGRPRTRLTGQLDGTPVATRQGEGDNAHRGILSVFDGCIANSRRPRLSPVTSSTWRISTASRHAPPQQVGEEPD